MKPAQRYQFIKQYLAAQPHGDPVDILNRDFVDAYDEACKPPLVEIMPYGANKIPQLSRDLRMMWLRGWLKRNVTPINGMGGMGFPRWIHTYRLKGQP